jgi:hypothetical protein
MYNFYRKSLNIIKTTKMMHFMPVPVVSLDVKYIAKIIK